MISYGTRQRAPCVVLVILELAYLSPAATNDESNSRHELFRVCKSTCGDVGCGFRLARIADVGGKPQDHVQLRTSPT